MRKYTVWSNDLNIDEWEDYVEELKEENPEISKEEIWYRIDELNNDYLDDERINTKNCYLDILCIGDIGRWNGRRTGYKTYSNLSDIFYSECDICTWYIDEYKQFRFTGIHHDGTNHYLYRIINPGISDDIREKLLDSIGTDKEQTYINRYTTSLGRWYRKEILGFTR